jgi:hypothetical protein
MGQGAGYLLVAFMFAKRARVRWSSRGGNCRRRRFFAWSTSMVAESGTFSRQLEREVVFDSRLAQIGEYREKLSWFVVSSHMFWCRCCRGRKNVAIAFARTLRPVFITSHHRTAARKHLGASALQPGTGGCESLFVADGISLLSFILGPRVADHRGRGDGCRARNGLLGSTSPVLEFKRRFNDCSVS